jgi:phosphoribosyl-ATP pyrophosphohydrolase
VGILSVTLRDAQHLCWKTFTKINSKIDPEGGKRWIPPTIVTDLLEEANQISVTVNQLEDAKAREKAKTQETLANQLSNLLYTIFVLAEHQGIKLEDVFLQTVNDYILRYLK